jgi:DNA-binding MarR family transcriptional regulator
MIDSQTERTQGRKDRVIGRDLRENESGPAETPERPAHSSAAEPLSFLNAQLDLRILQALRRIIRAVEVHSRKLEASYDVTSAQLLCLMAIKERGPLTLSAIARNVFMSSSTLVGIVDRLERKGWVVRRRGTHDRREVSVSLTDPGRLLLDQAPSPLQDQLAEALQKLPELEQVAIAMSLERVVELMETGRTGKNRREVRNDHDTAGRGRP